MAFRPATISEKNGECKGSVNRDVTLQVHSRNITKQGKGKEMTFLLISHIVKVKGRENI